MYVVAYLLISVLVFYRLRTEAWAITKDDVISLLVWSIVGLAIGGRIGYALFYDSATFVQNPLLLIWPFERTATGGLTLVGISGLSYHGALIGIVVSSLLYCWKHRHVRPLDVADLFFPAIPLGYAFGRLGNFINGELYGRATSVPWAMIFPADPLHFPRHPSQLYEAFLEGIVMFVILWPLRKRKWFRGWTLPAYLFLYAVARITVEWYREPDPQLGFVLGPFTMGQILSSIMVIASIVLFVILFRRERRSSPGPT